MSRPLRVSGTGAVSEKSGGRMFLNADNDVCFDWLVDALQRARVKGQAKVVGYLEEVLEEVIFEMKAVAQS
jgi:hypothetical protein